MVSGGDSPRSWLIPGLTLGILAALFAAAVRAASAPSPVPASTGVLPPSKQAEQIDEPMRRNTPPTEPLGITKGGQVIAPTPFTWPTGIFKDPGGYPSEFVTIENVWQGVVDGEPAQIYAGADRGSKQGYVVVIDRSWDGGSHGGTVYETPTAAGPVTIDRVEGRLMTLSAPDGSTFLFDVEERAFV